MAAIVTVVNRTKKTLEAVWDGFHHQIPPGKSAHPLFVAEAAKRQNPVMGTEDQITGEMESLIGIEENGDDCSPIEQTQKIERWDRKKMPGGEKDVQVVAGKSGLYAAERHTALPLDSSFVNPK